MKWRLSAQKKKQPFAITDIANTLQLKPECGMDFSKANQLQVNSQDKYLFPREIQDAGFVLYGYWQRLFKYNPQNIPGNDR